MIVENENSILDYIIFHENVAVADICAQFDISESTVRRQFTKFEKLGFIKRYHGGAYIIKKGTLSNEILMRSKKKNILKMNIAKAAAQLINDGDVIILLGGTTVLGMCEFIINKKSTVITNSLAVFTKLQNAANIDIILLGGLYDKVEMETRGNFTLDRSAYPRANALFMGATSASPVQGITAGNTSAAALYTECAGMSDKVYVLADSSKFRNTRYASVISADSITGIITDKVDADTERKFINAGTKVYLANS